MKNAQIRGLHPTNSSSSNDANLKREYQISFQDSNEKFLRKFQNLPTSKVTMAEILQKKFT